MMIYGTDAAVASVLMVHRLGATMVPSLVCTSWDFGSRISVAY